MPKALSASCLVLHDTLKAFYSFTPLLIAQTNVHECHRQQKSESHLIPLKTSSDSKFADKIIGRCYKMSWNWGRVSTLYSLLLEHLDIMHSAFTLFFVILLTLQCTKADEGILIHFYIITKTITYITYVSRAFAAEPFFQVVTPFLRQY